MEVASMSAESADDAGEPTSRHAVRPLAQGCGLFDPADRIVGACGKLQALVDVAGNEHGS